jgi:hypothetical protein
VGGPEPTVQPRLLWVLLLLLGVAAVVFNFMAWTMTVLASHKLWYWFDLNYDPRVCQCGLRAGVGRHVRRPECCIERSPFGSAAGPAQVVLIGVSGSMR